MWKSQLDHHTNSHRDGGNKLDHSKKLINTRDDDDQNNHSIITIISSTTDNYSTTITSSNTTNTILLLIDNDIHLKPNITPLTFNLLKLKFQNQQLGKLTWLKNRELHHQYDYIPIEFSKDLYFVSNFIKRKNQQCKGMKEKNTYFRHNWYGTDYFNILSDELKKNIDIVANTEINHYFNYESTDDMSFIERINRIASQSEDKCIEIICQFANLLDIGTVLHGYKRVFPFVSEKLLNSSDNREFILKCIASNYKVFKFIKNQVNHEDGDGKQSTTTESSQTLFEFILKCVNLNVKVLKYIDSSKWFRIFNDKQVMMKVLQSMKMKRGRGCQIIFDKLSKDLRRDIEIVLLAAEKGIPVLLNKTCSKKFANDREIVLHSVRNSSHSIDYASDQLRQDREIIYEAIRNYSSYKLLEQYSSYINNDKEFIIEMITKHKAPLLQYAPKDLQQDEELLLLAIKNHPDTLGKVLYNSSSSSKLLSNREFILKCVRVNGLSLLHAPLIYRSDVEIVNEAIKQNPFNICYFSRNITIMDQCKNVLLNGGVELMHLKYELDITKYREVLELVDDLDLAMKLLETIPQSIHFLNDKLSSNASYQELIYRATLLHNGYWMEYSEDAYQERINHAYYSAKINSGDEEINYYRNFEKKLWENLEWKGWN